VASRSAEIQIKNRGIAAVFWFNVFSLYRLDATEQSGGQLAIDGNQRTETFRPRVGHDCHGVIENE